MLSRNKSQIGYIPGNLFTFLHFSVPIKSCNLSNPTSSIRRKECPEKRFPKEKSMLKLT